MDAIIIWYAGCGFTAGLMFDADEKIKWSEAFKLAIAWPIILGNHLRGK